MLHSELQDTVELHDETLSPKREKKGKARGRKGKEIKKGKYFISLTAKVFFWKFLKVCVGVAFNHARCK